MRLTSNFSTYIHRCGICLQAYELGSPLTKPPGPLHEGLSSQGAWGTCEPRLEPGTGISRAGTGQGLSYQVWTTKASLELIETTSSESELFTFLQLCRQGTR